MICHARDVVADDAVKRLLLGRPEIVGGKILRVPEEMSEEVADAAREPIALRIHNPVRIQASKKEFLDLPVLSEQSRPQLDEAPLGSAHLSDGPDAAILELCTRRFDQVGHQRIQQPLQGFIEL